MRTAEEQASLEEAKSEALAAFAAIAALTDLAGEPETSEHTSAISTLRASAVHHLQSSLEIIGLAKGGSL
jgi:tRNA threonylcarbamoyladenosine modification (KEOPS) complex Cgi121 subunit